MATPREASKQQRDAEGGQVKPAGGRADEGPRALAAAKRAAALLRRHARRQKAVVSRKARMGHTPQKEQ